MGNGPFGPGQRGSSLGVPHAVTTQGASDAPLPLAIRRPAAGTASAQGSCFPLSAPSLSICTSQFRSHQLFTHKQFTCKLNKKSSF